MGVLTDFFRGTSAAMRERFYRGALIGPEDGPWIHDLPEELVARLASISEAEADDVAKRWCDIERADIATIENEGVREHMLAGSPLAHWRTLLGALATFARATLAEGRRMHMWVSL